MCLLGLSEVPAYTISVPITNRVGRIKFIMGGFIITAGLQLTLVFSGFVPSYCRGMSIEYMRMKWLINVYNVWDVELKIFLLMIFLQKSTK